MSELRCKIEAGEPKAQMGSAWYCTATSSRFAAHYHDDLELNVVVRGTLHYRVEGNDYEIGAGSRVWLLPGALHELVEMSRDAAFWVFTCKAEHAQKRAAPSQGAVLESSGSPEQVRQLSALGSSMLKARRTPVANESLRRVLQTQWQERRTGTNQSTHPALTRAAALLEDVSSACDIPGIAERCGLGHEHFTRLFSSTFGVPPVYYRNHQRVQAAIQLLESRETNLLHAALEVGFGSYAQFHRAFIQVTDDSPRARFERRAERHALPARVSLMRGELSSRS